MNASTVNPLLLAMPIAVRDLDGAELASKTMSVNAPLRFGGVTAYQTDWSMSGLQLQVEGSKGLPDGLTVQLPMAALQGEGRGEAGRQVLWWGRSVCEGLGVQECGWAGHVRV